MVGRRAPYCWRTFFEKGVELADLRVPGAELLGAATEMALPDARASTAVLPSAQTQFPEGSAGSGGAGTGEGGRNGAGGASSVPPSALTRLRTWVLGERTLRTVLLVLCCLPLIALALLVAVLLAKALPAIKFNGAGFFVHDAWRPGNFYGTAITTGGVAHPPLVSYGALPLITGTLLSAAFGMLLAVPVAFGTALVVVEKLPPRLSSSIGFCMEVLAGVPSVVYGLWGVLTLGPFLAHDIDPVIARFADDLPNVAPFNFWRGPTGAGEGLFTSALVLAIMILPIIAATTRDLLRQVPRPTIEGAVALGMTDMESMRTVSFRWVRSGVIGAAVLGLGRALGETIAIAMVSGVVLGANVKNFYDTFTTIAATIVSQLDSAFTDSTGFAVRTLAELALVLLLITLVVNIVARLIIRRVSSTALPVGVGL